MWHLCSVLATTLSWTTLVLSQSAKETDLQALQKVLPSCSASCLATLAPEYSCSPLDTTCVCANANLSAAVIACLGESCTVKETLTSLKFSAQACDAPVRDQTNLGRVTTWPLFALSIVAVALRFIARSPTFDGPGYGWDDWTMLVVIAFLVPEEVGLEIMIQNGLGRDIWMLAPDWEAINIISKFFWTGEMYYTVLVNLTKVAILLLYLRIFPSSVTTWFRTACWSLIAVCLVSTVAIVLTVIFECNPVAGAYLRWDGQYEAKCIDTYRQVLAMAAINILLDLLVFALPIPNIMKLNASLNKRIGICLTFLVGLFVTIVSILRLQKLAVHMGSANPTWDMNPIAIWTQAEVNVGIVCACMPSFARLIRQAWTATVGRLSTKISSIVTSSHPSKPGPGGKIEVRGQSFTVPKGSLAKTVETHVYTRNLHSTDEVELMDRGDKESQNTLEDGLEPQHRYRQEW